LKITVNLELKVEDLTELLFLLNMNRSKEVGKMYSLSRKMGNMV
jgi:hypothetical protein